MMTTMRSGFVIRFVTSSPSAGGVAGPSPSRAYWQAGLLASSVEAQSCPDIPRNHRGHREGEGEEMRPAPRTLTGAATAGLPLPLRGNVAARTSPRD